VAKERLQERLGIISAQEMKEIEEGLRAVLEL